MSYCYVPGSFVPPPEGVIKGAPEKFSVALKRNRKHPDENLFSDVLPFDRTRVNRSVRSYYNGSWVLGQIAAQEPGSTTLHKFWKAVWHNEIKLIQMVCASSLPSWKPGKYRNFTVKVLETERESVDDYEIVTRKIELTYLKMKKGKPSLKTKTVTHRQLVGWSDMGGVPCEVLGKFVQKREPGVKTLTHCKAGVGRTGTVIAVQWAMEQTKLVNLIDLIAQMRLERPGMVQKEAQCRLIYDTLSWLLSQGATNLAAVPICSATLGLPQMLPPSEDGQAVRDSGQTQHSHAPTHHQKVVTQSKSLGAPGANSCESLST